MRILMSAFGSRGDAQRFIMLAGELRRRGHDVVVCGYAEYADAAGGSGVLYVPCASEYVPPLVSTPELIITTSQGAELVDDRSTPASLVGFALGELESEERAKRVLVADAELVPLPGDIARRVAQVPAILPPFPASLSAEVTAFLDSGDPPVFLGFGSMPARNPALLTRDLVGAVRGLGVRAIVERGWAGLGREGVRDVLFVDDAPHAALFPRCAVVVHHGGAGTTALACRAGAPQVVVPQLDRQHFWAERVAALGLGERMPRRYLTSAALHDRLGRVLRDERYRFRAQVMAERLRSKPDGTAGAADAVLA